MKIELDSSTEITMHSVHRTGAGNIRVLVEILAQTALLPRSRDIAVAVLPGRSPSRTRSDQTPCSDFWHGEQLRSPRGRISRCVLLLGSIAPRMARRIVFTTAEASSRSGLSEESFDLVHFF